MNTVRRLSGNHMLSVLLATGLLVAGCAPESLYTTSDGPAPPDGYILMAPYFTSVRNQVTVSLALRPGKADNNGNAAPPAFTATVSLTPIPTHRSYAFVKRNTWFNTSAELKVGSGGMLSTSDTSSHQQFSAILTELAQTAASLGLHALVPDKREGMGGTPPAVEDGPCLARLKSFVTGLPMIKTAIISGPQTIVEIAPAKDGVSLQLAVNAFVGQNAEEAESSVAGNGLVAYLPSPGTAELRCVVAGRRDPELIAAPVALNFYLERIRVDPKRDGWRDAQDTYTFTDGFLTAHKYTDQSPAKTVVDTVTSPIRAIMPSSTVTQTTSVQSNNGVPGQTTNTTQTVSGPPKN
jgi:hypothetical protein